MRKFITESLIFRSTIFFQPNGDNLHVKGAFKVDGGMPDTKNGPVICAARRTPHGLFGGSIASLTAPTWASYALKACANDVGDSPVSSVILGCVLSAGLGQAPARQALISAGLSTHTDAMHINKVCGSGMAAVIAACHQLGSQPDQLILAGGMESMSGAPSLINDRFGYRFGHQVAQDHLLYDGLEDRYEGPRSMGCLAERMAEKQGIGRDVQDTYALQGAKRALAAQKEGLFDAEMTPVSLNGVTLDSDETLSRLRPEKISSLKPAFKEGGTITAATSSALADGAAALALTSSSYAAQNDISPLARVARWSSFSGRPDEFILAPIEAAKRLLKDLSWDMTDVDVWEVNEAFAVVPLAFGQALNIPQERMNVCGGALALGHPLGASGARILVTLVHTMVREGLKRGVAAICIGGGEGLAVAIER